MVTSVCCRSCWRLVSRALSLSILICQSALSDDSSCLGHHLLTSSSASLMTTMSVSAHHYTCLWIITGPPNGPVIIHSLSASLMTTMSVSAYHYACLFWAVYYVYGFFSTLWWNWLVNKYSRCCKPLDPIPFFEWLLNKKVVRVEVNISLAFLHWVGIVLHPWPFFSDIAIFVRKGTLNSN